MEIVIGAANRIEVPKYKNSVPLTRYAQAKILNIRKPRNRYSNLSYQQNNRRKVSANDPVNGKVITLIIQNENSIPNDLETENYTIQVKFIPGKK
jgi:hypothetical protein